MIYYSGSPLCGTIFSTWFYSLLTWCKDHKISLYEDIKRKPPSSDVLYVEITSFVVVDDHIRPVGSGDLLPPQNQ